MPDFNILVIGPKNTGKTVFLHIVGGMQRDKAIHTIPSKHINITTIAKTSMGNKLTLYDFGGTERIQKQTQSFHGGTHAVILMADFSVFANDFSGNLQEHCAYLKTEINKIRNSNVFNETNQPIIYLVASKDDTLQKFGGNWQAATNNLRRFARDHEIPDEQVYQTSSVDEFPHDDVEGYTGNNISPKKILTRIESDLVKKYPTKLTRFVRILGLTDGTANPISRFFGTIFGALLGAGTALLIHNPVACFLAAARAPYFAEWGHANWLRILLAPVVNPVMAVLYGLKDGAVFGAQNGVTELAQIPKNENFKLRTVIGSFLVSALVVAAAIAASPLLSLALPIVAGIAGAAAVITVTSMGVDLLMSARELSKARKINRSLLANTDDDRNAAATETLKVQPPRPQPASSQKGYGWALLNEYKNADRAQVDSPIKENPGQSSQSYRSFRSWVNVAPRPPVTSAKQAEMASRVTPQASR